MDVDRTPKMRAASVDDGYREWLSHAYFRQQREEKEMAQEQRFAQPSYSRTPALKRSIPRHALPSTYIDMVRICDEAIDDLVSLTQTVAKNVGVHRMDAKFMAAAMRQLVKCEWILVCAERTRSNVLFLGVQFVDVDGSYGSSDRGRRDALLGSDPALIVDTWISNVRAHGIVNALGPDSPMMLEASLGYRDGEMATIADIIRSIRGVAQQVDALLPAVKLVSVP